MKCLYGSWTVELKKRQGMWRPCLVHASSSLLILMKLFEEQAVRSDPESVIQTWVLGLVAVVQSCLETRVLEVNLFRALTASSSVCNKWFMPEKHLSAFVSRETLQLHYAWVYLRKWPGFLWHPCMKIKAKIFFLKVVILISHRFHCPYQKRKIGTGSLSENSGVKGASQAGTRRKKSSVAGIWEAEGKERPISPS